MNERIQELAQQANLRPALLLNHYDTINALTYSEQEVLEQIEKFAELIVRECVHCVLNGRFDEEKFNADDLFDQGHNKALNDTAEGIKSHFGVIE